MTSISTTASFNPRPLLLTGESPREDFTSYVTEMFQSTPVIANGRIDSEAQLQVLVSGFQSTPVIANGRILEIFAHDFGQPLVSIHARYC